MSSHSTVDLEESSGASDVVGFPKAAQDLIHSLRLELTATRLDMVTLSQQLQKLGVVPQSSRGVSLVNDVDVLRKENDRLRETMAAHSGDVVPLVLYEQVGATSGTDQRQRVQGVLLHLRGVYTPVGK